MTTDELVFFDPKPSLLPLYEALRNRLFSAHPDLTVRVTRTQIAFRNRHLFAMVSFPRGTIPGRSGPCLLISFGLGCPRRSPRIFQAVEACPNRWTHHVPVSSADELDGELMDWLEEAYQFANGK